jgi:arginine N-succinyltransferase
MLLVRPVQYSDLPAIERLAVISGGRMTTLPANRDHLHDLISKTQHSLKKEISHYRDESYHFVLEDTRSSEVVGISGIDAAVGLDAPFYNYRLDDVIHASSELQIHNKIPSMHLCQDYTGAARLCTLFIDEAYRTPENLNLLSRARMLFMAQHPERFAHRIIAEIQGVLDDKNLSPFWEGVGKHFFDMDFNRANYLTGINSKGFIAELMPHHPIYAPLLPKQVQSVIGQPRQDMKGVVHLLEDEGFSQGRYIDIFDAGPTLEARTQEIRSIAHSVTFEAHTLFNHVHAVPKADSVMILSNTQLHDFAAVALHDTTAFEAADMASITAMLGVTPEDLLRMTTIPNQQFHTLTTPDGEVTV